MIYLNNKIKPIIALTLHFYVSDNCSDIVLINFLNTFLLIKMSRSILENLNKFRKSLANSYRLLIVPTRHFIL